MADKSEENTTKDNDSANKSLNADLLAGMMPAKERRAQWRGN